jgi:uncharacterized protein YjbJ (UPF0337 family)
MSGKADQAKGRVKEAAGALADDERLKNEGKVEQAAGKVKEKIERTIDRGKEAVKDAGR